MSFFKRKKYKFGKKDKSRDKRLIFLAAFIFLFGFLIIARLFDLQILHHAFYNALASGQQDIYTELFPERGEIFFQDTSPENDGKLYPCAINQEVNLLYAKPINIDDPDYAADKLTEIFNLDDEKRGTLFSKLSKRDDPYEPIMHKVDDETAQKIKDLNIKGLHFTKELVRYYPEKNIGSHIVGFVGYKGSKRVGQYGIEGYFDKELRGKEGYLETKKDARGNLISIASRKFKKAEDGDDLVLTIDSAIQYITCDLLSKNVLKYGADGGTIIIMNPKTGAILAMCSYPDFDPNNYFSTKDINTFNNPAIFYPYEPGSIFKAITMAAALDEGKVEPNTTYVDEGKVKVGPYTIKNSDHKAYGVQTMTQVLEKSLNLGAIYAVRQVGKDDFRKYVKDFGFGQLTGIRLDSEVAGDISSLNKRGEIFAFTASYGQGITVTPLQMVTAFAAIANKGRLLKPFIIDRVIKDNGEIIKTPVKEVKQVISPKTSTLLSGMLVSAVKNGYGRKANVPGYYIGGKTGTAQVASSSGGYSNRTIHSFVGFGPVDDPAFAMIVKLDNPKSVNYAADSAAPLFGQLANFLLKYYQIPPAE